jgi:hypothetical protein
VGCQASSSGNIYGVVLIMYYLQPKVICRRRGDHVGGVPLYGLVSLYSYLAYGFVTRWAAPARSMRRGSSGPPTFFVGYEVF